LKIGNPKKNLSEQIYEKLTCDLRGVILNKNKDMENLDLTKIQLPLSEEKFKKLSKAIETGRIRWRDLSRELTYAYQAFWRAEKHKNYE
jgi:hypothetical protein